MARASHAQWAVDLLSCAQLLLKLAGANFASLSICLCLLGRAGRAELHAAGLHTWTCACSAAWLLATASAALCCPEDSCCLCHTGMEAAELSLCTQQVSTQLHCDCSSSPVAWRDTAGQLCIVLAFPFLCFISFPSSHFSV